jgi:predicted phage tail protein
MLIDKIYACTSSMNELSAMRTNALSLSAYEAAVNQLAPVDSAITEFVATVEEMNKHEFCKMNLSAEEIEKMKDAIKTCAGAVNQMTLNNNDVAAISSVFKSQKTILTALWNSAAKTYVTPIRSYLGIIQTFAANKEDLANLSKALNTGSTAEPSAAIVKTLVSNVQKANAITSNFQMSDGVRAFLQKAKNGSATFADITPDVSQWITEQKLGSRIKLSF